MGKEKKKEKWSKPKLVILTRGKPEEGILQACKGGVGGGPLESTGRCVIIKSISDDGMVCGSCRAWAAS